MILHEYLAAHKPTWSLGKNAEKDKAIKEKEDVGDISQFLYKIEQVQVITKVNDSFKVHTSFNK